MASLGPAWGQLASVCQASGPPGRVGWRYRPCPVCTEMAAQIAPPCPSLGSQGARER